MNPLHDPGPGGDGVPVVAVSIPAPRHPAEPARNGSPAPRPASVSDHHLADRAHWWRWATSWGALDSPAGPGVALCLL